MTRKSTEVVLYTGGVVICLLLVEDRSSKENV